jgi:hypothetical protein
MSRSASVAISMPAGGHEEGIMAITECDQIPQVPRREPGAIGQIHWFGAPRR